jgi:hypothetical protein
LTKAAGQSSISTIGRHSGRGKTFMKAFAARNIIRVGRFLRDAWLVIGVTLLFIVFVEAVYRGQRAARAAVGGSGASDARVQNPFDTVPWSREYTEDHLKEEEVLWSPYVYVRNPAFRGRHMSVDSLGHRITPHPAAGPAAPVVRVFFLGGSTTFGWYQRDSMTIPAQAARRLQTLAGDRARIEVTNFGVPGHTFTQEILELLLQLRSGARPDIVVFYDGINDVMATVQNGRAGLPQNEANREADFMRGRSLAAEREPGLSNDLRVAKRLAVSGGGRLQFVRRLAEGSSSGPAAWTPSPGDSLARNLVTVFAENARIVEALAASHGFRPLYVWQPALLSTRKRLTAFEQSIRRPGRIGDVHRAVPTLIDSAMKRVVGERFIDATDLFADDTLELYADLYGHTFERANPRIVDTLMTQLRPAIQAAIAERPRAALPVSRLRP